MKDFYSKYKSDDLWCIKEDGFYRSLQSIRESQFTLGNGFIGSRGVLEEIPYDASPGTYISGIYDSITSQVAEIVNLPNPFNFKLAVNGEKLGAVAMDITEHKRVLDMRKGFLVRRTVYSDSKKRRYDYQSLRFVSMHSKNIGVMQIVLTALDDDVEIELYTGIDTSVYNSGVMTEGRKKHFRVKELAQEETSGYLAIETFSKQHRVIYRSGFHYKTGKRKVYATDNVLQLNLKKGQPLILTKVFYVCAVKNDKAEFKREKKASKPRFNKAFHASFDKLFKDHAEEWQKLWSVADVAIEGPQNIQRNLRFNIYHMLICAHVDNGASSIGARTLSGEGYRGHVFWDAEIFLLPFYNFILPEVAKNMLLYRYNRLDQAREIAQEKGFKGAMFPWESAGTGYEETPTWAKDLDGAIIKIKTDRLEQHISADIAYACYKYAMITADKEWLRDCGYEIIFETARFWASRVELGQDKKYHIKDVIGPDEFHEHVDDNAYTNMMAKWNLLTAYRMFHDIKKNEPLVYSRLIRKINLKLKEVSAWKVIAPRMKVNMRKDKVIEQFDGFFKRRHIEIVNFDENGLPILPEGIKVKDYNKTQLVKQADVLMLTYLLSSKFTQKTKESNFWYYVDRTLHKSSLSPVVHALMALQVGAMSRACQFFNVSLGADISNIHGNAAEGVHAASLGGTWQVVINGFVGVRVDPQKDILSIDPNMPRAWKVMKCSLFWKKNLLRIEAQNNAVRLKIESRAKRKVQIAVFGEMRNVAVNREVVFRRKKTKEYSRGYYL